MARATTAKFEELIVEVEFDPVGASGTYTAVCGMIQATITRTSNIDTSEIPYCDNEGLPLAIEREVRSQEVSISGTGVWALQSHEKMLDWWYGGSTLNVRVRNAKVVADGSTGDTTIESGPALLASLSNSREKGQRVTAEIEIQFDGVPTRTAKGS
ncbi:hypothetical protein GN330_16475 [Nitratireductor sp. CAU 1489]|uniref:Phage tail tube protein n=1 Tax=Nitratireductor arenosus TaxID=2682096 RepID=A0A844QJS1_9HYPH|nr:phage tail tube protein [Nitratireductor arenosus]MVA98844.1 hypothetical protein [Nitratireductor arenosus]